MVASHGGFRTKNPFHIITLILYVHFHSCKYVLLPITTSFLAIVTVTAAAGAGAGAGATTSSTTTTPNLYKTLNVNKDASSSEIKKAYRKLALQTHPDKVDSKDRPKAEAKFKEISKAHEILSNEETRKNYDLFGNSSLEPNFHPGFAQGGSAGGAFPGSARSFQFGNTMGGMNGNDMGGFFQSMGGGAGNGSEGIELDLGSIFQSMMGGQSAFRGNASPFSGFQHGPKSQKQQQQSQYSSSPFSDQSQQQQRRRRTKPITRSFYCTLEDLANPNGCTKKLKVSLPAPTQTTSSSSSTTDMMEKIYTISVKPGWKSGTKVSFKASKSEYNTGVVFPPMTFVMKEKPHAFLERNGNDLVWECKISSKQAKEGATKLTIPLPDGELLTLRTTTNNNDENEYGFIKLPILDNDVISIEGKGMPIKGGPERGSLIIKFRINADGSKHQDAT